MNSRRRFLQQSSAIIGGSVVLSALNASAFQLLKTAPSDQINVGVIGINGMGWSDLQAALTVPGVNLAAICDVDKNVIDKRLAEIQKNPKIDASNKTDSCNETVVKEPADQHHFPGERQCP